jgi:hypothetical protein
MAWAVITVASGGIAVVDNTAAALKSGMAVTEAVAGTGGVKYGAAVTKVASGGLPVMFVVPPP